MRSVAFICPSLSLGGAERHLVRYVRGLHDRGYRISIIVISSKAELVGELPPAVEVVFLNTRALDLRGAIALHRKLSNDRPDTVIGWSDLASILACITAPRSSRLITCELNYPPLAYQTLAYLPYLAMRALTLLYRRADVVTANSDLALEVLEAWVGRGPRFMRIFNPIEFDEIERLSLEVAEVVAAKDGHVRIVAVGRLDNQHKGFDILVSALQLLSARPDWSCVIVGGGATRRS